MWISTLLYYKPTYIIYKIKKKKKKVPNTKGTNCNYEQNAMCNGNMTLVLGTTYFTFPFTKISVQKLPIEID